MTDLTRPCHSQSKRGELLAALVKGQVHLYHGGSGIKVRFFFTFQAAQSIFLFAYPHIYVHNTTRSTAPFRWLQGDLTRHIASALAASQPPAVRSGLALRPRRAV